MDRVYSKIINKRPIGTVKVAEQGDASAQFNLGTMYDNGHGVLQDYKQAYMWFNLARYNGYDAEKSFNIITPHMTTKDISHAQEMSKSCLESNYTKCN
ncbi:tetratricopeptide repeat protein [Psychromonas sp. KJ10-10]|uniref:tetratricopeptide repeat protein n=1 Tax=Psychromonas sp. KJ10-10 TaxID=3391823 RepID=UPI0039B3E896